MGGLPGNNSFSPEQNRRTQDEAHQSSRHAGEEILEVCASLQASVPVTENEHQGQSGEVKPHCFNQCARNAAKFVAKECCQHAYRTGRQIADGHTVEKLLRAEPGELRHQPLVKERHQNVTAAEEDEPDFEKSESQYQQAYARCKRRDSEKRSGTAMEAAAPVLCGRAWAGGLTWQMFRPSNSFSPKQEAHRAGSDKDVDGAEGVQDSQQKRERQEDLGR